MPAPPAHRRLAKEYQTLQKNPTPYITTHPSESNILEWHYILEGPPDTPYVGGQYWGTLVFPPTFPFAPPAIRMHTPSGRLQPSTRICLSISDFHPKSFNPTLGVNTILIGLLSFMTSEEVTTGSVSASAGERRAFAAQSRWWNSTGGGSTPRQIPGLSNSNAAGHGNVKAGDGGAKFRSEWPELDVENWKFMTEHRIDPKTGRHVPDPKNTSCAPGADALRRRPNGSNAPLSTVADGSQQARERGQSWIRRNKLWVIFGAIVGYTILARLLGDG